MTEQIARPAPTPLNKYQWSAFAFRAATAAAGMLFVAVTCQTQVFFGPLLY